MKSTKAVGEEKWRLQKGGSSQNRISLENDPMISAFI
jgi:hypothetical protein